MSGMTTMEKLEAASTRHKTAQEELKEARTQLAELIVTAAKEGVRQTEIVKVTGYTRESVRKICRDAGIG